MTVAPYCDLPFEAVEERWLLSFLAETDLSAPPEGREDLAKRFHKLPLAHASWTLPVLYHYWQRDPLPYDKSFLEELRAAYVNNVALNLYRIELMKTLSRLASQHGFRFLFVKGAAEIVEFAGSNDYLATRTLLDTDFLCPKQQLDEAHRILIGAGHTLYDYGLGAGNAENRIISYSLENFSHLVYNHRRINHLELHDRVCIPAYQDSYPVAFNELLFDAARSVRVGDCDIPIPRREHMVVYLICHAAGLKDNAELVIQGLQNGLTTPALNQKINAHQMKYVFQLRNLLAAYGDTLDWAEISRLLGRVKSRSLLRTYLNIAWYLQDQPLRLPFKPPASPAVLETERQSMIQELSASQSNPRYPQGILRHFSHLKRRLFSRFY